MKSRKHNKLLTLGLLGLSSCALYCSWLYINRKKNVVLKRIVTSGSDDANLPLSDAKVTEKILYEYGRALFESLYEVAQTAQRLHENLEHRNLSGMISQEDLTSMLMTDDQREVYEKILKDLLIIEGLDVTVEEFELFVEKEIKTCPILLKYKEGIEKMFEDAIEGKIPLVPNLTLPLDVTPAQLMSLVDNVLRDKRLALDVIFRNKSAMEGCVLDPDIGFVPTPEASSLILNTAKEAELNALKKFQSKQESTMEEGFNHIDSRDLSIAFKCLVGQYCRNDPLFASERSELMNRHTEQILILIKNTVNGDGSSEIPAAVRSHPLVKKLGGTTAINDAENVADLSSSEIIFSATFDDMKAQFDWNYRTIVVCTDETPKPEGSKEMPLISKLNCLTFNELSSKLSSNIERYEHIKVLQMGLETIRDGPDGEMKDKLERLLKAVTGDDASNGLPAFLYCPVSGGCQFVTRDVDELFRRIDLELDENSVQSDVPQKSSAEDHPTLDSQQEE